MDLKIGIVMLGVRDLNAAAAFYREKLGMASKGQTEGFAFLDAGPVTLALTEALAKARPQIAGATEVVLSVDHVRESYQKLKTAGVIFLNEPRVVTGTSWAVNFTDPDGHLLSLFGPE
jgi:catechol 2,3-dioxygenase-like lactoylglutathione lyase family enzyme